MSERTAVGLRLPSILAQPGIVAFRSAKGSDLAVQLAATKSMHSMHGSASIREG